MNLHYHSHLGAEHILASVGLLQELDTVLRSLALSVWPGKSASNPRLDVVQQMLNAQLEAALVGVGWLSQAQVIASAHEFYADFYRKVSRPWALPGLPEAEIQVLGECQFGNTARLGLDNEKFRIGRIEGRCDVGVEIVPVSSLAQRIDGNVATFKRAQELLRRLGPNGLPTPVLVIGLEAGEQTEVWNLQGTGHPLSSLKKPSVARQVVAARIAGKQA